jgi:SMC interacting uncharacterized protein involved in chromosome segregation
MKINEKLELGTIKWSQDISAVREETHQRKQVVNSKFNSLSSSVYESLERQMSETKQNHTEMSKKLHDHKKEVESKIEAMQSEIVNLQQELIVDCFCVL